MTTEERPDTMPLFGVPPERGRSLLFDNLSPEERRRVHGRLSERQFARGDVLIHQGEEVNALYIVRRGVLSVDITTPHGERQHATSLIAGECAGEVWLITGLPATATVTALVECDVWTLRREDFVELMSVCSGLVRNLGVILSQRLAATDRGYRSGLKGLMRVRVHPEIPPHLPERVARSIARHLATPLLVLDHRLGQTWASEERVSELEAVISDHDVLERLRPEAGSSIIAAPTRELPLETWARFDLGLPDYVTHVLVIRDTGQGPPPELRLGGATPTDLTLWPAEERAIPDFVDDVALVLPSPDVNSLRRQEELSAEYGKPVIRVLADHDEASIGWLARHLCHLKVGVALGGGGARGFSHLGVLRGLRRAGVPIDYITGCSIGAIVASCFAYGYDVDTIARMMVDSSPHLVKLTVPRTSLLSRAKWERYFRGLSGDVRMEDLPLRCAVVASDVLQRREVVLDRGLVWKSVLASAAIPGIYPPMWIGEHCLFDGALLDPVPAGVARTLGANLVIGVSLMGAPDRSLVSATAEAEMHMGRSPNLIDVLMRSFDLVVGELSARAAEGAEVTLVPEVEAFGIRDFERGRSLLPAGELALEKGWTAITMVLPWLRDSHPPSRS